MPPTPPEPDPPAPGPSPRDRPRWVLADHLRGLIYRLGFRTLTDAAARIGMSPTQLGHYLGGQQPTARTLEKILRGLGRTHRDLLRARPVRGPRRRNPAA